MPRTTPLLSDAVTLSRSFADFSAPRVTETTSYPAFAKTSMIPVAMVPEPTTPTFTTGRPSPGAGAPPGDGVCASGTTSGEPGLA